MWARNGRSHLKRKKKISRRKHNKIEKEKEEMVSL